MILSATSGSISGANSSSVPVSPTVCKSSREPTPAVARALSCSGVRPLAFSMFDSSAENVAGTGIYDTSLRQDFAKFQVSFNILSGQPRRTKFLPGQKRDLVFAMLRAGLRRVAVADQGL